MAAYSALTHFAAFFGRDLASVHSLVVADDNHVERVDEFVDAAADCRSQLTSLLDGNRVRL